MTYFKVTAGFQIVRKAETLADAERIFAEMVRDGFTYVELAQVHEDTVYTSQSLKIHW